ncbi:MAG: DUF1587 domain-containing protein, partial [Planctomycetales bacterium]
MGANQGRGIPTLEKSLIFNSRLSLRGGAWLAALWLAAATATAETSDLETFEKNVRPLLVKHCARCHGSKKQEGKLRLDRLNPDLIGGPHAQQWHEALNKLNVGEMPPEDEPQPTDLEREQMTEWLTNELKRVAATRRGTMGRVVLRRLNRLEYGNTLRDLLGVQVDFAKALPPEGPSPDGFTNNGQTLTTSPLHLEYYAKIARQALNKAIAVGLPPVAWRFRCRFEKGKLITETLPELAGLTQQEKPPRA